MNQQFTFKNLSPEDFEQVITLANHVHGAGYLDLASMQKWYSKGLKNNINLGFVVYDQDQLIGFRITYAANQWEIDQWCTPSLWNKPIDKVCYFKCNTIDEKYRGQGLGGKLLDLSVQAAKEQGAVAGVSHLWKQSPGNSAVKYFTKSGGQLIKEHANRWSELTKYGYECTICGTECDCQAAEMLLDFER